ncbi:MAG: hypothetical protein II225_04185 [Ruminococcus sp.]|nr:hypothetical protein [Ruminococcus sp.]
MNVKFNGFGENVLTFEADSALTQAGVAVPLTKRARCVLLQQATKSAVWR